MKKLLAVMAVGIALVGTSLYAQEGPPEGRPRGEGRREGGEGGRGEGRRGGGFRFEAGRVLPGFLREALKLTEDQTKQIDALEAETKTKLMSILTDEQKKTLENPPAFGRGGRGGQGGEGGEGGRRRGGRGGEGRGERPAGEGGGETPAGPPGDA